MSATRGRYRPPFVTQRGIDSTLDDCSVVATLHGIAYATLGEYVTTPQGREMTKPQLQALARQMRKGLGRDDATGGLSNDDQVEMCRDAGFPAPAMRTLDFPAFKALLKSRKAVCSIGGNPARIKGPSPLKRCDCAHEWLVAWDPACKDDELLVYDGLRPATSLQRGEVRPASEVRQMCFKDSDGELTGLLAFPIGGWDAESVARAESAERIADLEEQAKRLRKARNEALAALAKCQAGEDPDCVPLVEAARAQALSEAEAASSAAIRALR